MKLGVIGAAGRLGATTAFCVGLKGIMEEIKLMDVKDNFAKANVMDIGQALLPLNRTRVSLAESYADFSDCEIVYCAAAKPYSKEFKTRAQELEANIQLIAPICKELKAHCSEDTILIISANPVDVFVYVYQKLLGWDKRKVLGLAMNDSIRVKWAVSEVMGLEYERLSGISIGEHGEAAVRLFDQMEYDGEKLEIGPSEIKRIEAMCSEWFANWVSLETGTTTGYTSGVSIAEMIEAIALDTHKVYPCTTPLCSEIGYDTCAMGLPIRLGRNGVEEIVVPELTPEQTAALDYAAEKITGMIKRVGF